MNARELLAEFKRDPDRMRARIEARRARLSGERSFAAFVKQAWPQIDGAALKWNWYLDAVALHLEQVARGGIRRLVGNGPPRCGKSNLFAVLWPVWVWTWEPRAIFIYLSYSDDLVVEHSAKCRQVIESHWYRELYRPEWRLAADQNAKHDFLNTVGGRRIASSIKSGVTGRGAWHLCVDDPLSAEEANSPAERDRARRVIKQAANTRFNDPKTGTVSIFMQRVHNEDPTDWALKSGYEHLCTPMERAAIPCTTHCEVERVNGYVERVREPFWTDPRPSEGDLLDPERFSREIVSAIKLGLGPAEYAAQFQQSPLAHVGAGKYFPRGKAKFVDVAPAGVVARVRRWDLAATEGAGDWTVGVRTARLGDGTFCVEDVVRAQLGPRGVRELVKATAELDGYDCPIVVPQDPGSAGKDVALEYVTMLAGYTVTTPRESGPKEVRAGPASSQWTASNVVLVRAPWNEPFVQTLDGFPDPSVHDDDVDAFAGSIIFLTQSQPTAAELYEQIDLS